MAIVTDRVTLPRVHEARKRYFIMPADGVIVMRQFNLSHAIWGILHEKAKKQRRLKYIEQRFFFFFNKIVYQCTKQLLLKEQIISKKPENNHFQ